MDLLPYILIYALIYSLLSLSLSIHYSAFGFFDISFAGIFIIAPNIYFLLTNAFSLNAFYALLISLILSVFVTVFIYIFILIPLKIRGASNAILLIISIGVFEILMGATSIIFKNETRLIELPFFSTIETASTIILFCLLGIFLWYVLRFTIFGKVCRALNNNTILTAIHGIKPLKYYLISTSLTSFTFGLVGIIIASSYGITNYLGFEYLLFGLSILIISGNEKPIYLLITSFIFSCSTDTIAFFIGGAWKISIAFIILISVLAIKPYGLKNLKRNKVNI